jgi:hypothetical protein
LPWRVGSTVFEELNFLEAVDSTDFEVIELLETVGSTVLDEFKLFAAVAWTASEELASLWTPARSIDAVSCDACSRHVRVVH